jgi:MoaA/NifB/PqqE/SkfB family radical SAM enzyme
MDTMDKVLYKYQNGNTEVTILEDGTKIREFEDTPEIIHPESLDCKITNYCDLGCKYCHENSTTKGTHADLSILIDKLIELPGGVELAIGGGNPLSHPDLEKFLLWAKNHGLICNITVNQAHLKDHFTLLNRLITEDLVKGVGISIVSNDFSIIETLKKITNNIVYHVIAGVNDIEIIDKLINLGSCKVLILGYKDFGRGINYRSDVVDKCLLDWYQQLSKYLGKCVVSFDNLAIEQLNVKRLLTPEEWEQFYMGDDFTFTMYIDAVNEEYAPTSRSDNRLSFNEMNLIDYFQNNKLDV